MPHRSERAAVARAAERDRARLDRERPGWSASRGPQRLAPRLSSAGSPSRPGRLKRQGPAARALAARTRRGVLAAASDRSRRPHRQPACRRMGLLRSQFVYMTPALFKARCICYKMVPPNSPRRNQRERAHPRPLPVVPSCRSGRPAVGQRRHVPQVRGAAGAAGRPRFAGDRRHPDGRRHRRGLAPLSGRAARHRPQRHADPCRRRHRTASGTREAAPR